MNKGLVRSDMQERDLQEYLFGNPGILFPDQNVQEKAKEFHINGRRIDLLFRVDDVRYIVELKAVPLTREHIGQVAEYYGLMRQAMRGSTFKMMLVAPSIPDFRRVFLEELGIRCFEIPDIPTGPAEADCIRKTASDSRVRESTEEAIVSSVASLSSISYDDLAGPVTQHSLALSHRVLRDTLADNRNAFAEYDVLPIKMARAESPDVICDRSDDWSGEQRFSRGGAWWAYAFGHSEQMPKNDVPNISAMAMPWGFDVAVNAELRTSQAVMTSRMNRSARSFDKAVNEHRGLEFQALLKLEHQPRFYHWMRLAVLPPGTWCANDVLRLVASFQNRYSELREEWVSWILKHRADMSPAQASHMQKRNQQPNIALRIVRPFPKPDPFWSEAYATQCGIFVNECRRLKPILDILID